MQREKKSNQQSAKKKDIIHKLIHCSIHNNMRFAALLTTYYTHSYLPPHYHNNIVHHPHPHRYHNNHTHHHHSHNHNHYHHQYNHHHPAHNDNTHPHKQSAHQTHSSP